MPPAKLDAMLHAIAVIAMDVETIEAQKKLSQHKGEPARQGAMAGLRARGDAASLAVADLMQAALDKEYCKCSISL